VLTASSPYRRMREETGEKSVVSFTVELVISKTVKRRDFRVSLFYQVPVARKQERRESKPDFACHISILHNLLAKILKSDTVKLQLNCRGCFSRHSAVLTKICIARVYRCTL